MNTHAKVKLWYIDAHRVFKLEYNLFICEFSYPEVIIIFLFYFDSQLNECAGAGTGADGHNLLLQCCLMHPKDCFIEGKIIYYIHEYSYHEKTPSVVNIFLD